MKVSLVIMAAGLGSRFTAAAQAGGRHRAPQTEILMEHSIYDASGRGSARWCSSSSRRWRR
ncbi:MAG: hypothetical protein ACLTG0_08140 [Oscillibacter sp.]